MSTKRVLGITTVVICIVIAILVSSAFFHVNNVSQLQEVSKIVEPIGKGMMYSSGVMSNDTKREAEFGTLMYSSGVISNDTKREAE